MGLRPMPRRGRALRGPYPQTPTPTRGLRPLDPAVTYYQLLHISPPTTRLLIANLFAINRRVVAMLT